LGSIRLEAAHEDSKSSSKAISDKNRCCWNKYLVWVIMIFLQRRLRIKKELPVSNETWTFLSRLLVDKIIYVWMSFFKILLSICNKLS
jgi:hypothetical protein